MLNIACRRCQRELSIQDEFIGKTVECPSCKATMQAPAVPPSTAARVVGDSTTKDFVPATLPPAEGPEHTPPGMRGANDEPAGPGDVTIPGYEMLGVLGRGGMGVVYRARHVKLNRLVALKMILAGSHAGQRELDRFQ